MTFTCGDNFNLAFDLEDNFSDDSLSFKEPYHVCIFLSEFWCNTI